MQHLYITEQQEQTTQPIMVLQTVLLRMFGLMSNTSVSLALQLDQDLYDVLEKLETTDPSRFVSNYHRNCGGCGVLQSAHVAYYSFGYLVIFSFFNIYNFHSEWTDMRC